MAKKSWPMQIRNARSFAEQVIVLRTLKNEVVGHPVKKELVVASGALEPIIQLSCNRGTNRLDGKAHDNSFAARPLVDEELVRLQGLQILSSIALGGHSFLAPLHSAGALPAILSNLCPSNNPASLVLASLRALSNLLESSALASSNTLQLLSLSTLADTLFARHHINSLSRILSQGSPSSTVQCQISIASSLISRLCREERHQQALANCGALDALATRLASFIASQGLVLPGAEVVAQREGLLECIPLPAPRNANLTAILEALAVIIKDSKYRASQLIYSPSILAIFPMVPFNEFVPPSNPRAAWNAFNSAGLSGRQSQLNAIDYLIPFIPFHQMKASAVQNSAFPPLGSSAPGDNLALNGNSGPLKYNGASLPSWTDSPALENKATAPESPTAEVEEPESPLVVYLILLLRSRNDLERLMAAYVLTALYRSGLTSKSRESAVGLLVLPLLVQMLDDVQFRNKDSGDAKNIAMEWAIKEQAPHIIADLIKDSEYLHKAAFDAGVVSKLSKMMKISYNPVLEDAQQQPWSPHVDDDMEEVLDRPQSSSLGLQGQPSLLAHKIRVRESTLKAIAALVPFKDKYRKLVVDQGIIPYIIESMNTDPKKPSSKVGDRPEKIDSNLRDTESKAEGYGHNPVSVLIAACGAIQALSRSVSILRTTLIDNGVAMPVFNLLQHPDIKVQIAASAAVCNLVTDVSPMRESVAEAGVVKILCEQARSMSAALRINALWALKHFVCGVNNDMKRLCLEELGQGWLVQLICDDTEEETMMSKNDTGTTPGSSYDADEDVEMDQFEDTVETHSGTNAGRSTKSRPSSSRSKCIQQAETRLATLRDAEVTAARKAKQDHIAVQEQGLEFIRNLISGASPNGTSETTEMIDFLFNALGQDRVFEILTSKLRPKVIKAFSKRTSSGAEPKVVPPLPEIIAAVTYILVHMAASVPRHRQLVIAQAELLKLLVPQFFHPKVEVRTALCYLVTNLTWMDDAHDATACVQRANELKKLGFLAKIEMLEDTDPELTIRQRAKCAIWQMKQPA